MHFIPILPTKHLQLNPGLFHLSLAHMYLKHPKYGDFFRKMHKNGRYVIMDNSAYELPKPYSIEELWSFVGHFGASELVIPDVLKDPYATGQASREALEFLGKRIHLTKHLRQLMIVPQGKDILEWIVSLEDLLSALQTYTPEMPFTIGIAKHTHSYEGGRLKILDFLSKNYMKSSDMFFDIHLLGINESLEELREIGLSFGHLVRSIDSARPAIYANIKHRCELGGELPETKRPADYFDLDMTPVQNILRSNISQYHELVKLESDPSWRKLKYLPSLITPQQ